MALFTGEFPARGSLNSCLSRGNEKEVGSIKALIEYNNQTYESFLSSKPEGYIKLGNEIIAGKKVSHYYTKSEALFGSSHVMLASVFSSQNGLGDLCDIKPSERRQFFARLLDFSHLQTIADKAKDKAKNLKEQAIATEAVLQKNQELVRQLVTLESQLKTETENLQARKIKLTQLQQNLILYQNQSQIQALYQAKLREYEAELSLWETFETSKQEIVRLQEIVNKETLLSSQEVVLSNLKQQIDSLKEKQNEYNVLQSELSSVVYAAKGKGEQITRIEKQFERVSSVPCNFQTNTQYRGCQFLGDAVESHQSLPALVEESKVLQKKIDLTKQKSEALKAELGSSSQLEGDYLQKRDKYQQNKQKVVSAKEQLEILQKKVSSEPKFPTKPELPNLDTSLTDVSFAIKQEETAVEAIQRELGRLTGSIETAVQAQQQLTEQNTKLTMLNEKQQLFGTLQEIFGPTGIQPYLIETLKAEIEKISNELLSAVYPNLKISISTQKELKSKDTLKEEINIYVLDGEYKSDVQSFSGGEKRIVKLCLRFALSIFTSIMSGRMYKTLFIDEAFDNLDLDNSLALLDVLRGLKKYFEQVFIVSHNAQLLSSLPTVLRFYKEGRESKYQVIKNG